jgi:hypothetical protein
MYANLDSGNIDVGHTLRAFDVILSGDTYCSSEGVKLLSVTLDGANVPTAAEKTILLNTQRAYWGTP